MKEYLNHLAACRQVSASSQRQALNALVFLYREAYQREPGDFSDYTRARIRTKLPVVLTRVESQTGFGSEESFGSVIGIGTVRVVTSVGRAMDVLL